MKRRNVLKDDKAVSPVIATILMVAVTVVLAATLYMMLPKSGENDASEAMSARLDTASDGWLVRIDGGRVDYDPDHVQLFDADSGAALRDEDARLDTETDVAVHSFGPIEDEDEEEWFVEITFNDNDGDRDINVADSFRIRVYDGEPDNGGSTAAREDMPDGYKFRIGGTNLEMDLD